jgi:RES domain-containing protein
LEFARLARLLDGMGTFKFGGRWMAAGVFPAVNVSLTQEAAMKESAANFTYYNFASMDVRPKVLVGVRLKLAKVVDLTSAHGLGKRSWIRLDELLNEDWRKINDGGHETQSQALGRAIHDVGAEALLAPSARAKGCANVVFFPESLAGSSKMQIIGEDELERWLKKR